MVYSVKPPKTLVIGAKSFIGSHFYNFFKGYYSDTIGTHHSPFPGLLQLRLEKPDLDFATEGYRYAVIAAGISSPLLCNKDPSYSRKCNVLGALTLGKMLIKKGITPLFFSSDYVFDGSKDSYDENSLPSPLNIYGEQKAELEREAQALDCLVIRMTKVYGLLKGDNTLFDQMASMLFSKKKIRAAKDQILSPIFIEELLHHAVQLLSSHQRGLFNFSGSAYGSRFEMANYLAKKLDFSSNSIEAIDLDSLNDGIKRPKKIILTSKFPFVSWENGIEKYAAKRKKDLG